MRHFLATLAVVAVLAGAAGWLSYRRGADPELRAALERQDALEWLRRDFELSEAQFREIKRLHDDYGVVCEEHCRNIQDALDARNALRRQGRATAEELAAADRRYEELRLVCETAIATHVRQCAAIMSPQAGQRYLALVLPKIKDFDHTGAPDVRLHGPGH
ncbi:MAG TPA: hypothetical protein VEB66_09145 [Opitutaceae bacterium]|nr:hypothetical protein [Opitutaceae bacterium]